MSNIILQAENISKQYRLGLVGTGTLSHDLNRWWHRVRGKEDPYLKVGAVNDRSAKATDEYVWALQDINFEVQRGEVLGIIGKNGAGKSTLLKILSRVTSPTTGVIKTRGRIASLLEVGTGFHPELTGRENIFLNGAILGMTKSEIRSKIDEIVDFSGCEMYIDTPVKRYSSGMRVRLGFAVAAHLEPDILVVDEVLAVGDAEFQKKAIGKMQDVSRGEGRTILFVSHNMTAVRSLCTTGLVLENGITTFTGTSEDAVSYYLKDSGGQTAYERVFDQLGLEGVFRLERIRVFNTGKTPGSVVEENQEVVVETELFMIDQPEAYHVTFHLLNEEGDALFSASHTREDVYLHSGLNRLRMIFPKRFFNPGVFSLNFFLVKDRKRSVFSESDILLFTVTHGPRQLGVYMGKEPGYIRPSLQWENH